MAKRNRAQQTLPNPTEKVRQLEQQISNNPAPLVASVAIDRLTGRWQPAIAVDPKQAEGDIRILMQVLRQLETSLENDLVRMVEERGRQEGSMKEAKEHESSRKDAKGVKECEGAKTDGEPEKETRDEDEVI